MVCRSLLSPPYVDGNANVCRGAGLAANPAPAATAPPVFARESALNSRDLVERWNLFIKEASRRGAVPEPWIRAVMTVKGRDQRLDRIRHGSRLRVGFDHRHLRPMGASAIAPC